MRLNLILSTILIFVSTTTRAGEPPTIYSSTETTVGYNRATRQPITATQYNLPYGVYNISSDSSHNLVLVLRKINNERFANKGSLLNFDPESGLVRWYKDIINFDIRFTKDLILYNHEGRTKIMNKHTGLFMHTSPYDVKTLDYEGNKGLTWGGTYMDLMTNKAQWNQKLNTDEGAVEVAYLNDTTMLIASSGLHLVNTSTGHGWHYKMKTTKDHTRAVALGSLATAGVHISSSSVFWGGGIGSSPSYTYGLSSNMVYDTAASTVYYSAMKSTVALSFTGQELWKNELRRGESSKSFLWQQGDRLILINFGYALAGDGIAAEGTPFMVSYNKLTGDIIYNKTLGTTGFVTSFDRIRAHTLMRVGSGLYLYNHFTGDLVSRLEFDKKSLKGRLHVTSGKNLYAMGGDSTFQSLTNLHPLSFLAVDTSAVYRLDDSLAVDEQWPLSGIWTAVLSYKDLVFLRNGTSVAIVSYGELKAFIEVPGNLTVEDDKLLIADRERLSVIPLSAIL